MGVTVFGDHMAKFAATSRSDRQRGAALAEQLLLLVSLLLAGSALRSTLSHSITEQLLRVEIALAGGTSRTGGTDFCKENPRHVNCLVDDPLAAGAPTTTGRPH